MKKKILKITLSIVLIVILVAGIGLTYLVGAVGGGGPFDFVWKNKLKKMPGNAEKYSLENIEPLENSPLEGKRICYLGSSVTLGLYSMDVSFADYISYRNGCEYVKEAVSGTTLVDNGKTSYIQRMKNNIGTDEKFDAFVCQLSTNDASKEMPMGELSSSENLEDFDTQTVTGAMEYIIVYAKQTWNCPVIFYTGTKYDSKQYQQMVDVLFELQDKYGIGVIDLWNDEEMNDVSEKEYEVYMDMKNEQRKIVQMTTKLSEAEEDLLDLLKKLGLYDAKLWLSQVRALVYSKDMVEVRHDLNTQRQKLRKQIEYHNRQKGQQV